VERLQRLADLSAGLDRRAVAPLRGEVPGPRILERLDLACGALAVVLGEEDVVGGVAVERRIEVDEVDRPVGDVAPQDVEIVAVVEDVTRVVRPWADVWRLPSRSDGGKGPDSLRITRRARNSQRVS